MRTTLVIDDDVIALARELAESRRSSIGEAVSYLARRGTEAGTAFHLEDGFPVFDVDAHSPQFGNDEVQAGHDAEEVELAAYFNPPKV